MDEIVKLDARDCVKFSSGVLECLGLKAGDLLTMKLEGRGLRLTPRRVLISGLVGKYTRVVVAQPSGAIVVNPAPVIPLEVGKDVVANGA